MEKHIEARLRMEVKKRGGMCLKWVCPGVTGVPDRIVLMPEGKIYFIELKDGKAGRLSARQEIVQQQLRKLGFTVMVITTTEEIKSIINLL